MELPGPWKMKPGLCQPPERTWHSRGADGETEAQGCIPAGAGHGHSAQEGPPWTHRDSQGQNWCLGHQKPSDFPGSSQHTGVPGQA